MNKKIGIFGGSFDPIHKGHIEIAQFMFDELSLDKLIFVPAYQNPFKTKQKQVDPIHRLNMIKLVLRPNMEVSDFEINRKGISYTIDTVKYFSQKYANDRLYVIIGSDNLPKLSKWKDIDEIRKLAEIAIYPRSKVFNKENAKKYNCIIPKTKTIFEMSSTNYKRGNLELVDEKVQDYIGANLFYLENLILNIHDALLHKHSSETAKLAAEYGRINKLDSKKLYLAGLLHDIGKNASVDHMRAFLSKHNIDHQYMSDKVLHGPFGSVWLEKEYKVKDKEILSSIYNHSTVVKNMTTFDKIIFMADKLCYGRKYEGIQKVREIALKDIDEGFSLVCANTLKNLIEKKVQLSPETKGLLEYYSKGGK